MSPWSIVRGSRIAWLAVVVGLAACAGSSGDEAASVDSSPTDVDAVPGSDEVASATDLDAPPATTSQWQHDRVEILTAGVEPPSSGETDTPEVMVVGSSSSGFIAAGRYAGGLTIWGSDDFEEFTPLYNEVCCDRSVYPTAVVEFDGVLLVSGNAFDAASGREVGVIVRSDDGGESWVDAELEAISAPSERVDEMLVVGDSLIVRTVDETADSRPESKVFRTSDLVDWDEIVLPGIEPSTSANFVADDESLFAVSYGVSELGGTGSAAVWSSSDGGRTFDQRPPAPHRHGDALVVDGALIFLPSASYFDVGDTERRGIDVLAAGDDWVSADPDVGQFGDGTGGHAGSADAPGDDTYVLLGRELRGSAHYCYDDADTCKTPEIVLAAATGPTEWFDVDGLELPLFRGRPGLEVASDGTIVIWNAVPGEGALDVYRWSSPQLPDLVDPPSYPPPSRPVELFDARDALGIGDEFRYVLPTGFCGGMYINDSLWEPETPLPDPLPPQWPYLPERPGIGDGPEGYLFGRIEMTSADAIDFSIEDVGVVATYRPSPPPDEGCG